MKQSFGRRLSMSIIIVILLTMLSGCGTSYGQLSADEKGIIDWIFDNKSIWASEDCAAVWFGHYDGNNVFCVSELDRSASNPAINTYTFNNYYYTFDNAIKKIGEDRETKSYVMTDGKKHTFNPIWYRLKTDEEKKEYLAEQYIKEFK